MRERRQVRRKGNGKSERVTMWIGVRVCKGREARARKEERLSRNEPSEIDR